MNAEPVCEQYNFEYIKAETEGQISNALERFFEDSGKPKLLEVFTPRTVNDEVLLEYFNFMKS